MRKPRLYPFSEPVAPQTTASNSIIITTGTVTTYRPNPFHGIDRWLFALDEWQHRHGNYCGNPHFPWLWWRHPLGSAWWLAWQPYCNWWDRRLLGEDRS